MRSGTCCWTCPRGPALGLGERAGASAVHRLTQCGASAASAIVVLVLNDLTAGPAPSPQYRVQREPGTGETQTQLRRRGQAGMQFDAVAGHDTGRE